MLEPAARRRVAEFIHASRTRRLEPEEEATLRRLLERFTHDPVDMQGTPLIRHAVAVYGPRAYVAWLAKRIE